MLIEQRPMGTQQLSTSDKDAVERILSEDKTYFTNAHGGESFINLSELREDKESLYQELTRFLNTLSPNRNGKKAFDNIDVLYIF